MSSPSSLVYYRHNKEISNIRLPLPRKLQQDAARLHALAIHSDLCQTVMRFNPSQRTLPSPFAMDSPSKKMKSLVKQLEEVQNENARIHEALIAVEGGLDSHDPAPML